MIGCSVRTRIIRSLALSICLLSGTAPLVAQQSGSPGPPVRPHLPQVGIFLVFPFENSSANARLDWIGEGLEELTIQRLSAAGQQVYSHEARLRELDRYGFPSSAKLTRATMLHIGEEMDADYVVFGDYKSDGKNITISARLLRVNPVALLPVIEERDALASLMELHARLTWEMLGTADHGYPLNLAEFSKLQQPLRLTAFEQYIRGLLANDDDVRLRDLKEAARLEPNWPDPAFAIGELYFQKGDCNDALPWFARVPSSNALHPQSWFSSGVCRLRLGQPDKAEEIFTELEQTLHRNLLTGADVPEILNNLAIARARQNNFPPAQTALGRARDIDPDEDDYPFNLGLLALQQKEYATAETHFRDAIEREPDNPEDYAFLIYALDKAGKKPEAAAEREVATEAFGDRGLPLLRFDSKTDEPFTHYQRIKPDLDTTSLRLEFEAPPIQEHAESSTNVAVARIRSGRQNAHAGRLDAAEKDFQAALAAEPNNAIAHRELADIYRRRGKLDDAARELQLSLKLRDSAVVRTTLARIYLEQKKFDLARVEVQKAIALAPNYAEAKELLDHLEHSKPTGGAQ
jgi:tetratricopeptide (TPR) repeat protein